jgi:hypothetical protein
MTHTKRIQITRRAFALGALVAAGALPLAAQQPPAPTGEAPPAARARAGVPSIELLLAQRGPLALTADQVGRLNTLRTEVLETRQRQMDTAMRVRSDLAAGEITRAQANERLAAGRPADTEAGVAARIDAILTDEQRTRVQEMRGTRGDRPGAAMRGGDRPGAGQRPGGRGGAGMQGRQRPGGAPGGPGPRR